MAVQVHLALAHFLYSSKHEQILDHLKRESQSNSNSKIKTRKVEVRHGKQKEKT